MSFYIPDTDKAFKIIEEEKQKNKNLFSGLIKKAVETPRKDDSVPQATYLPQRSLLEKISIFFAITFYYFFAGLTVLIRGKVPKSYQVPRPEEIKYFIHNVSKVDPDREEKKKYGKVVDLDFRPPTLDLLR